MTSKGDLKRVMEERQPYYLTQYVLLILICKLVLNEKTGYFLFFLEI
jgi:hypothetical protein